ncbi:hypothetical protein FQN54_008823 [Arachnomyces sp. PD_36]|nr:hypothetical protein FQN54_008823 [Arachnomyces sp. PD_36]
MLSKRLFNAGWLAVAGTASASIFHPTVEDVLSDIPELLYNGLQSASVDGLLQVAPSFVGDGITVLPALDPNHNPSDLSHLIPEVSRDLYFSQEGHRRAIHGAKHAQLKATFNRRTVVLDHSNQIKSVECTDDDDTITVCFKSPDAMWAAEDSWGDDDDIGSMYLATYHPGCGDESGTKRSFFEASVPFFNPLTSCVAMSITRLQEEDALDSGVVSWGTYLSPHAKRANDPARGHVRLTRPLSALAADNSTNSTVDLTENAEALKMFFNSTDIDTSEPAEEVDDIEFVSNNGTVTRRSLEKRGPIFDWIVDGAKKVVKAVEKIWNSFVDKLKALLNLIETLAEIAIDLLKVPFGYPFERNYHNDFDLKYFPKQTEGAKPPKIFGFDDGFALSKPSAAGAVQCAKCGIVGDITVDGEFAFSIKDGITKGEISFENKETLTISAILGITVKGTISGDIGKIEKQLKAQALSPFSIPGIFTIGPQVSVSAAATLDVTGRIELLTGGELTIAAGIARASLVDKSRNKLTGFTPEFKPVFKATAGEIGLTMDFGLPVALEAGLDVLNGKFKKTIGVVNTPSIYVTEKIAGGEGADCQGLSLTVGAKNKIHIGAFDLFEFTLIDFPIWKSELFCINIDGIASKKKISGEAADSVAEHFGGEKQLATNQQPELQNLHTKLKSGTNMEGFRILMDLKETSILVSGKDGGVYFTSKKEAYDLTAPWGTVDSKSNVLTFDVFGRLLNFEVTQLRYTQGLFSLLYVNTPSEMPGEWKPGGEGSEKLPMTRYAASIAPIRPDGKKQGTDTYALTLISPLTPTKQEWYFYPTACQTAKGLRVIATRYVVRKDGSVKDYNDNDVTQLMNEKLSPFGMRTDKCRTVKIKSDIKGGR